MAQLLHRRYSDVFSQGEKDVGRTELVQHAVLIVPDSQSLSQIWTKPEIDWQVSKLAHPEMKEPTQEAWSLPVVLVK